MNWGCRVLGPVRGSPAQTQAPPGQVRATQGENGVCGALGWAKEGKGSYPGTRSRELPSMVDGRAEKRGPGSRSWGPRRTPPECWAAERSLPVALLTWQEGLAQAPALGAAPAFLQRCPSRSCHSLLLSFPCRSEVTPTEFLSPRPAVLSPPLPSSPGVSSLSPEVVHPLSQICALLLPTFPLLSHHPSGHISGFDVCLSSTM